MSSFPVPRDRPVDVKVYVSTGAGLDVVWGDAHRSHYDFPYLRDRCPCAVCNDHRTHPRNAPPTEAALPLFKPRVTARNAAAVGHYALQFEFSDGHVTGIYSFDYLREICPCDECRPAGPAPPAR
ncbi:MAG TPA: DUF971 domain-containing protein [Candidatus Acidoferrales bacterium]|nr:DUF971 domain-containing protein [Candidatus Acidoferrales bacterium]